MRIAHVTDIHWQTFPPLRHLLSAKRILGTGNLYAAGRRHHFDPVVQDALVDHVLQLRPDALAITGDLTAQALPSEFERARATLEPVLQSIPTLVIPGNHDLYTPGAAAERRIHKYFGAWMGLDGDHAPVARMDIGNVTFLGLDPNRPHLFLSSGILPSDQLTRLSELLPTLADRRVVLMIHYPILSRTGEVYDRRNHGLLNANELIAALDAAPVRPEMILHGHVHHGYRAELALETGDSVPTFNCGSSGYAFDESTDRGAAMNVYTLNEQEPLTIERFRYTQDGFQPEEGGAYATGR